MMLLRLGFQFSRNERFSFDICVMIGNLVLNECIAEGVSTLIGVRRSEVLNEY